MAGLEGLEISAVNQELLAACMGNFATQIGICLSPLLGYCAALRACANREGIASPPAR